MATSFFGIAVDCNDAGALAGFWGAALGRQVAADATPENAVLLPGDETVSGPRLAFHRVPEGKVVKNRLHIDLISETFDAETERLLSLGARRLRDFQREKARWTTFADIEGNEFDLIAG
jgi:hypothetical protein